MQVRILPWTVGSAKRTVSALRSLISGEWRRVTGWMTPQFWRQCDGSSSSVACLLLIHSFIHSIIHDASLDRPLKMISQCSLETPGTNHALTQRNLLPPPKKGDLNCTSTRAWKPAVSPWIWPRFAPSTSRIHKGLQSFCFTLLTEMALKAITTLQQGVSESQQPDCTVKVALLVVSSSINIANIIQNLWKRASLLLVSIIEIHGYADPSIDPRIPQHRDMISVTSQWKTTTFEFRGAETCSISQIFCCQIGKKPRIC